LSAVLGEKAVVLAHGGLPAEELAAGVEAFRRGDASVLVGTTVVEVGIDVPEATLMVVDGAQHFGRSQLHHLPGRAGRGPAAALGWLGRDGPRGGLASARRGALARRGGGMGGARAARGRGGAGARGGTRQSGESGFLYLDRVGDAPWLARVGDDVAVVAE